MPVSIRIIDIPSSETIESDTKLLAIDPTNRVTRLIAANTFINLLENSLGDIANSGLEIAILAYAQANAAYDKANTVSGGDVSAIFNQANSATEIAINAYTQANAAYDKANTNVGGGSANATYLSVKDYGAIGDGIINDTTVIQSLINTHPEGGVIYFPPGNYLIDPITLIPKINLLGSGTNSTKLVGNTSQTMFAPLNIIDYTLGVGDTSQTGFQISDLSITSNFGQVGHTTPNLIKGINFSGYDPSILCENIILKNLNFDENCIFGGFDFNYCKNVIIDEIIANNCPLFINHSNDLDINNINCFGSLGKIEIKGTSGDLCNNLKLSNINEQYPSTSRFEYCNDGRIINSNFETGTLFTYCNFWNISSSIFSGEATTLDIFNSNFTFNNCQIKDSGYEGIKILTDNEFISLGGCLFANNAFEDLKFASSNTSIIGNIFESTYISPTDSINETGGDFNLIVNNIVKSTVTVSGLNTIYQPISDILSAGGDPSAYGQANAAYAIANAAYNQANTNISSSNTGSILAIAYLSSVFGSL